MFHAAMLWPTESSFNIAASLHCIMRRFRQNGGLTP